MGTLHIAPGYSAGESLTQALGDIRPQDAVLRWPDDLSCGPIDTDLPSARAKWWGQDTEDRNLEALLHEFWGRVFNTEDNIIVWFAQHAAGELAFFLNWTDRLKERPYHIIDATGRQFPFTKRDGSAAITEPTKSVGLLGPKHLASLLGTEREPTSAERDLARNHWQRLKMENAQFRIVSDDGLVSAPAEHFDRFLLEQATPEWQKMSRLIGFTMVENDHPYHQVGGHMLQTRVVKLIENGILLGEGDPWDMRNCRVRLPS